MVKAPLRPLYSPGMTRYPLYRKRGEPQRQSGQVWKISPAPEFDPRIVHHVASRYSDYSNPAHDLNSVGVLFETRPELCSCRQLLRK